MKAIDGLLWKPFIESLQCNGYIHIIKNRKDYRRPRNLSVTSSRHQDLAKVASNVEIHLKKFFSQYSFVERWLLRFCNNTPLAKEKLQNMYYLLRQLNTALWFNQNKQMHIYWIYLHNQHTVNNRNVLCLDIYIMIAMAYCLCRYIYQRQGIKDNPDCGKFGIKIPDNKDQGQLRVYA